MNEEWKPITCFKHENVLGNYEISNYGRVRNVRTGKIRKKSYDTRGYQRFSYLYWNENHKKCVDNLLIHQIVLLTFVGRPDDPAKNEIDHIDRNTDNNRLDNLRWVTSLENSKNKKPKTKVKKFDRYKPTWYINKETGEIEAYPNAIAAAEAHGISIRAINEKVSGYRRENKKYKWTQTDPNKKFDQ